MEMKKEDCDFYDLLSGIYENTGQPIRVLSRIVKASSENTMMELKKELDIVISRNPSERITSFNDYLTFMRNIREHRYDSEEIEFEDELL